MILLITPCTKVQACADALERATERKVKVSSALRQALIDLRTQEFSAVLIDQSLVEAEPADADVLIQHIGTAIPVHVNFAISGIDRVVREVRAALCRRKRESFLARKEAEQLLRSELKGTLTALLLSCELAMQVSNLPGAAEAKLRMVHDLAREMKAKLGMAATT
jgi:hypothetical protein